MLERIETKVNTSPLAYDLLKSALPPGYQSTEQCTPCPVNLLFNIAYNLKTISVFKLTLVRLSVLTKLTD